MNNQEILDTAPEIKNNAGALLYYSPESDRYYEEHDGYWYEVDDYTMTKIVAPTAFIRSLADIAKIAELEKEQAIRDLEQQAEGAIKLTNVAMKKLQHPKRSQSRLEYFKAGVRALAFAIDKESKALKEQGE